MRSAKMDNLRGGLMVLVVLGHLLELHESPGTDFLYLVVYSFHMPLFVWLCGYYARPADRGCLRTLVLPYLVFQVLYSLAAVYCWRTEEELKLLEPYWLMWFLMALLLWRLLLPLLEAKTGRGRWITLGAVLFLALLSGWVEEIRYVLSFQRTASLLPMFLLGYDCRRYESRAVAWWKGWGRGRRNLLRVLLALLVLAGFLGLYLVRDALSAKWFYWKYPYGEKGGTVWLRAWLICFAVVCLGAALTLVPERRLPALAYLGQNTMPVYLLHGFAVKTLEYYGVMERSSHPALLTAAALGAILLVCASPPAVRLFRRCFGRRSGEKS